MRTLLIIKDLGYFSNATVKQHEVSRVRELRGPALPSFARSDYLYKWLAKQFVRFSDITLRWPLYRLK